MSSFVDHSSKAYKAVGAIPAYVRVKKSGSGIAVAGIGDVDTAIGVTTGNANDGECLNVRLFNSPGTALITANGAIAENAAVYGDVNGTVSTTVKGPVLGYAEQAASGAGEIIEILLRGGIA